MNTTVQVESPLLDTDRLFAVVAAEVLLVRETLHPLSEEVVVLMSPFNYLTCSLVVLNTQCGNRHEHDRESDWIEA